MTLAEYMKANGLDDEAMAAQIGDCSPSAVKKWRYRERQPRADTMVRIQEISAGQVAITDWFPAVPAGAAAA